MNFNPRLREGGDEIQRLGLRCLWISIHASAREATFPNQSLAPCIQFQSTPPRGRRHKCISNLHGQFYFNPRLREGGDVPGVDRNSSVFDFNPRLREGGDGRSGDISRDRWNFNPRLREGGDALRYCHLSSTSYFNPRLREGGDRIDY